MKKLTLVFPGSFMNYAYSDVTHTMFGISYIKYCQYNHSRTARGSKACKAASKTAKRGAQL